LYQKRWLPPENLTICQFVNLSMHVDIMIDTPYIGYIKTKIESQRGGIMNQEQYHLRMALEHFDIRNKSVAAAMNVHPSMITRWANNQRLISINSKYLEPLASFILSRPLSPADMTWLEKRFREYGIEGSLASVAELKSALKIWLVSDPNDDLSDMKNLAAGMGPARPDNGQYSAKAGVAEMALCYTNSVAQLEPGTTIRMCFSDESLLLNPVLIHAICNTVNGFGLRCQMLLKASGQSKTPSRAVTAFMPLIIERRMNVAIAYEDAALPIDRSMIIIPECAAMMIAALPDSAAFPIALMVHEKTFIRDLDRRFAETFTRSQPLLASLERSTARQVQSLARQCYETTGALAIMRDGLNPLVLSEDGFGAYLKKCGYEGEAYVWRMDEFRKRKAAFDGSLKRGMTLRELVPLSLLDSMATNGVCTMFSEDFLEPDTVRIDLKTCVDLLEGYTHYLNVYPDFSLRLVGSFPETFEDSQCMLKENRQVLITKRRQDETESYVVSQQMVFLQGISQIFEQLWEGLDYVTRRGETTLQTLQRYILRIRAKERET